MSWPLRSRTTTSQSRPLQFVEFECAGESAGASSEVAFHTFDTRTGRDLHGVLQDLVNPIVAHEQEEDDTEIARLQAFTQSQEPQERPPKGKGQD